MLLEEFATVKQRKQLNSSQLQLGSETIPTDTDKSRVRLMTKNLKEMFTIFGDG